MEDGKVMQNAGGGFIGIHLNEDLTMPDGLNGIRLIADWDSMTNLIDEREPILFRYGVYWEYRYKNTGLTDKIVFDHDYEQDFPDGVKHLLKVNKNPKGRRFKKIYENIDINFGRYGIGNFDMDIDVTKPPNIGIDYVAQPIIWVGFADRIFFENHIEDYKRVNTSTGSKLFYTNEDEVFHELEYQEPRYTTKLERGGTSNGYYIVRMKQFNR